MTPEERPAAYPGVFTAYDFVVPSYNWMIDRLEAAENRLQGLQVFAATVSLGIPGAAKMLNPSIRFSDWRFALAAVLYVALMMAGLFARTRGGVVLVNPRVHQEQWLRFDEWEFKKNAVFWAAEHFRLNTLTIRSKANAAVWMTGLFVAELVLLLAWIATASVS